MANRSPERVLAKFRRLHTRYRGSDRPVSIAKVSRLPAKDRFQKPSSAPGLVEFVEIEPLPIVKDTADKDLQQTIGSAIGRDEKVFVFLADSLVERDPVSTLGARVEAYLKALSGQGRGVIRHGEPEDDGIHDEYSIKAYYAGKTLIGVTPQWLVLASAIK
jgi:hypothetical protein